MILYQVEYPFTVDEELGHSQVYATLSAAKKDAYALYAMQQQSERSLTESEHWDGVSKFEDSTKPAKVSRVTVGTITRGRICAIINSGGGNWISEEVVIGQFHWTGKRVKYVSNP